jgi:hypothetical protein
MKSSFHHRDLFPNGVTVFALLIVAMKIEYVLQKG